MVELLVVVGIIAILTAIITLNLLNSQKVARDTQRKSDIKMIQTALEAYRAQSGSFPKSCSTSGLFNKFGQIDIAGDDYIMGCSTVTHPVTLNDGYLNQLVVKNYLQQTPHDPHPGVGGGYFYYTDTKDYKVISYLPETLDAGGDQTACKSSAGEFVDSALNRACQDFQVSSNSVTTAAW